MSNMVIKIIIIVYAPNRSGNSIVFCSLRFLFD